MDGKRTSLLTSPRNPILKDVRKAVARGGLTGNGCVVAESFHLLEEALRSGCPVSSVLMASAARPLVESRIGAIEGRRYEIGDKLFQEICSTETSQGVIALVKPPEWSMDQLFVGQSLVVILDGIQDPGNAGAIVRAAEAFGATGCIFVKGSASPHNPKTLRASAGSLFRLPVISSIEGRNVRDELERRRLAIYAAMPSAGRSLPEVDLTGRVAILVGSEGRGVSESLRGSASDLVIPTLTVESLNAATAAGIVLYEARRQRMSR